MNKKKNNMKPILTILFLFFVLIGFSQTKAKNKTSKAELDEKQLIRSGNELYNQQKYTEAEANYKKAIEKNPNYEKASYNLGNAIYQQDRYKEALPMYELVTKTTENKLTKAESFHNIGNIMMKEKKYAEAVKAYKNALRNSSKDDETRYNLALAQKLLKKEESQKEDNKDKKDKDKKKNNKNEDKDKENKDKKKDDKEKDKDKGKNKKDDNKDKNKDQNKDKKDDKGDKNKDNQPPKPKPGQMTPQQVKQLLEAMNKEEDKTRKKINAKKAQGKKVKQEKDW